MIAGKDYFKWCAYPLRLSVSKFEVFNRYEHDCVCILEDQGNSLDLLFFNFLKAAQCKSFLVCFTAAVTKRRAHAKPPFFSGLGIAKSLGMPLLAIADPSLDLDTSLDLAWYIGSQRFANLQQLISSVITSVANKSSLNPILVGGSGGGFAALVQLLLRTNSDALVFNPQTDILNYHFKSIEKMMTVCFGSKPHSTSTPQKTNLDKINSWRQILESNNIISSVCGKDISAKGRLVYLQNSSDWHKTRFMLPFMRSLALTPNQDSKEFKVEYNNISFICGGWGEGHVVPPKELILAHINDLAVSH